MPVSHLGLTVSHIPSATSFYLSALQPLGYHYIGSQGDSIGLGIKDADFFLCQEQTGWVLYGYDCSTSCTDRFPAPESRRLTLLSRQRAVSLSEIATLQHSMQVAVQAELQATAMATVIASMLQSVTLTVTR